MFMIVMVGQIKILLCSIGVRTIASLLKQITQTNYIDLAEKFKCHHQTPKSY